MNLVKRTYPQKNILENNSKSNCTLSIDSNTLHTLYYVFVHTLYFGVFGISFVEHITKSHRSFSKLQITVQQCHSSFAGIRRCWKIQKRRPIFGVKFHPKSCTVSYIVYDQLPEFEFSLMCNIYILSYKHTHTHTHTYIMASPCV